MRYGVFTAQPLMLDGPGFPMFGPEHLLWLAICFLWIGFLMRRCHVLSGKRRDRFVLAAATLPLVLLASEDGLMIATGTFTAPWWPLHICNFSEYLCFIYAVRPNRGCRELLLTLGLSGGLCAMLFPGWSYCPAYTWPVICGFMEHATIFAISMMALSDPAAAPRWRDLPVSFIFTACYVLFFRWFNARMGTDFGFVTSPAAGSPLELWERRLGNPGYLVPYAALYVIVCVIMHAVCARRRKQAARHNA